MRFDEEDWCAKMRKKAHDLFEKQQTHTVRLVGGPFDGEDRTITFEPGYILSLPIYRDFGAIDEFAKIDAATIEPWKQNTIVDYKRVGWKETNEGTKLIYEHHR